MEWKLIWVLVLGLILGLIIGAAFMVYRFRPLIKVLSDEQDAQQRLMDMTRAADNSVVVAALAREIANELMERNAINYRDKFNRLFDKWADIEKKSKATKIAYHQTITSKYPNFNSFNELGTHPHVLYAQGFESISDDDLWDLYESIRLYDALSCELEEYWKDHGTPITEKERQHITKYCKKLSDEKLLAHLHNAERQYRLLKSLDALQYDSDSWLCETQDYMICRVPDFAEIRYGVYVKSMDRYGMWGLFFDDVCYTSFYAADSDFNEERLDTMGIRIGLYENHYDRIQKHTIPVTAS